MNSIEVKPGSKLHQALLKAVDERKKFSQRKMTDFHKQWDAADDAMRAYIPEKDQDRKRKNEKKYKGEVDYVTLEVPYTYAQVMTAHTYWSTVFLSRSPVWQFSARHGEAQDSVDAIEAVHDYQCKVGQQVPVIFNWIYDWARYSLGVVGIYWENEVKVISSMEDVPMTFLGVPIPGKTKRERVEKEVPGYVGNRLYNIRPYDFFPDPRVPIWRFQDGEFVIREGSEGWSDLLACAQSNPGYYVNIDHLKKLLAEKKNQPYGYENVGSPRVDLPLGPEESALDQPGAGFIKIQEMYIKLIPSMWGLGDSKRVQKYLITVADGSTVICVKPLGYLHDMFPFAVFEGNFGSDGFAKWGVGEVIKPLTEVITWLINSHFYNVRKVSNDTRVVDPTAIVMKDLERVMQGAGGIIRLKPEAYGRDVRTFINQLQNVDATQGHLGNIQFIEQMIQKTGGIVDNLMGAQNTSSSRKSATESRISANSATNRLKTPAEYNSALGFDMAARIQISNTQQLLDIQRKYAIAGNTMGTAKKFQDVSPEMIAGFYDFVPVDGALPVDPMAKAMFWKELIIQMAQRPEMAMRWDIDGMIAHMMKMQGERNIERFRIQVLPPGMAPSPGAMPAGVAPNVSPIRPGGQKPTGTSGGAI